MRLEMVMVLLLMGIIICLLGLVWLEGNKGYKCTSIKLSIWDNWKIFKFDELTIEKGVNYYLKLEEKSNNEIDLVVLKEVGRSNIMAEPKQKMR